MVSCKLLPADDPLLLTTPIQYCLNSLLSSFLDNNDLWSMSGGFFCLKERRKLPIDVCYAEVYWLVKVLIGGDLTWKSIVSTFDRPNLALE